MPEEIWTQVLSLGVSGLLFVMWWFERQERARSATAVRELAALGDRMGAVNEQFVGVIQANTEALTALRAEIRSHRIFETDWLERLAKQLDRMSAA